MESVDIVKSDLPLLNISYLLDKYNMFVEVRKGFSDAQIFDEISHYFDNMAKNTWNGPRRKIFSKPIQNF